MSCVRGGGQRTRGSSFVNHPSLTLSVVRTPLCQDFRLGQPPCVVALLCSLVSGMRTGVSGVRTIRSDQISTALPNPLPPCSS